MMTVSRHPLNQAFEWFDRPAENLRYLTNIQVDQYNSQGFFVSEKAVTADRLSALTEEIDKIEEGLPPTKIVLEDKTSITYDHDALSFARNLVAKSEVVRDFCRSGLFQGLTHDLLGENVRLYWDQAVYKKPEKGKRFPWHQDTGYTFSEPQNYVTCWIALSDADVDDGCPWVIPGMHKQGAFLHEWNEQGLEISGIEDSEEVSNALPTPVRAGDMVVFSSLTPHKTGPNVTDCVRKALIVQYMPDGLKLIGADGREEAKTDPLLNMVILAGGSAPKV